MTTTSDLKSRVDDITTCSICLELFNKPKSLPCLHTFCLKCLEAHCKDKLPDDSVQCPLCREEFNLPSTGVESLKSNFFLADLIDARKTAAEFSGIVDKPVLCENCAENDDADGRFEIRDATVYCVDCKEKLCEQCSRPHRRMKTGAHKVIAIGNEEQMELISGKGSKCEKHKNDEVRLYCFDCKENICLVCSAADHDQHKRQEINKVAAEFAGQIDADAAPLISLASKLRKVLSNLQKTKQNFQLHIETERERVNTTCEEVKRALENKAVQLSADLDAVEADTLKAIECNRERLQLMLLGLESFSAYCSELKCKGKPCDITRAANDLHGRATELKETDIEPFAGYFTPAVVFVPDAVTKNDHLVGKIQTHKCSGVSASYALQTAAETDEFRCFTVLDGEIYLVLRRADGTERILQYDGSTFSLVRDLGINVLLCSIDLVACKHHRYLYIADVDRSRTPPLGACMRLKDFKEMHCVYRTTVDGKGGGITKWPLKYKPSGLSVTSLFTVLVTCGEVSKLAEFTTQGELVREINLQPDIVSPNHAIQLSNGQFAVCHGVADEDHPHQVCIVDSSGSVKHLYGKTSGEFMQSTDDLNFPRHLAVDRNDFVYVADCNNERVLLLSPRLGFVREVQLHFQKLCPYQLHLDVNDRRLFVLNERRCCSDSLVLLNFSG